MSMARLGACMPMSCSRRSSSGRSSLQAELAERGRHRIAVEDRERQRLQCVELSLTLLRMGKQHAFDQFGDHGEPERIGAPARLLDRVVKALLAKQDLGVMPGAGAGILVDALLREEGRLPVDEIGERVGIADRRWTAEKPEQAQRSLRMAKRSVAAGLIEALQDVNAAA